MDAKIIGLFLKELRNNKGLKQKEVAEKIQVTDKAISRWETGRGIPDVGALQMLSEFFGVTINEILAGRYIREDEIREVSDQNIKMIVQEEAGLKKKLRIAIIVAIVILGLTGIIMIFTSTTEEVKMVASKKIDYSTSDIDIFFRDVGELEDAGIQYTIQVDKKYKIISLVVDVYQYEGKIEGFEYSPKDMRKLPFEIEMR